MPAHSHGRGQRVAFAGFERNRNGRDSIIKISGSTRLQKRPSKYTVVMVVVMVVVRAGQSALLCALVQNYRLTADRAGIQIE